MHPLWQVSLEMLLLCTVTLTVLSVKNLSVSATASIEEDVELVDLSIITIPTDKTIEQHAVQEESNYRGETALDLGNCGLQSKVSCIQSGTCESVPSYEPPRCRRRYCPHNKVYCLDFDGCMVPDPIFIFSLAIKEKKCPIPLSLCANADSCQYVHRKNYDDLKEPSLNRLNCSLMTKQIVFYNSSCKIHSECHWTSKCCPDGGLNRQCVSYDGAILPARISSEVNESCLNCTSFSNTTTGPLQPDSSSTPIPTSVVTPSNSLSNSTLTIKSITIRIANNYSTVVEGRESEFNSSMRKQLAKQINASEQIFTKLIVRNGSILLDVEMASSLKITALQVEESYKQLVSLLKNGSLVLTDLDGTQLEVPPQSNNEVLVTETKSYTTIIISVTAASLGTTLLLILWILWNNKNNKAIIPVANHLDRLSSHNVFRTKLSADNLIGNKRETPNDHFSTFADPQVQWEIFQKSFNKPGYVWQSQDEAVWAGVDHQVQWPTLDAPDEESAPITNFKSDKSDKKTPHI